MASVTLIPTRARVERFGLSYWMGRVRNELDHLHRSSDKDTDETVHDLRVAIRRCRSLAAVLREVDPSRAWEELRRQPRKLFRLLGEWRDAQVLANWAAKLAPAGDPVRERLVAILSERAAKGRAEALRAAEKFDGLAWRQLGRVVRRRARIVPLGGPAAHCLAVERLEEARELHARALRSIRARPWHKLRIGLKRFRYVVENLLPLEYAAWEDQLKRLQDLLGDVHDLDVLAAFLKDEAEKIPPETVAAFRESLHRERNSRILAYRQLTLGRTGQWQAWRSAFPHGMALNSLATGRLRATARALDPRPRRTSAISRLSMRLFDAFARAHISPLFRDTAVRRIFRASASLHGIGRSRRRKPPHKAARSILLQLPVPPGWSPSEWEILGWVIRYHRGKEPEPQAGRYAALSQEARQLVETLAGLLRLARALRRGGVELSPGFRADSSAEAIILRAPGWVSTPENESCLAKGKHLFERALKRPLLLLPIERIDTTRPVLEELALDPVAPSG
jgi:CHAD domain-containing protein